MAKPQIPADWHPATCAVDEPNKVVWKQGSCAVAMGLRGKKESLIPGYTIQLCTGEELVGVRQKIENEAKRLADTSLPKKFQDIAVNCIVAVAIGGPLGLFLFGGQGPDCDLDRPGITDGLHKVCWEAKREADKKFSQRSGVLMLAIAGGLTWRSLKRKKES